MKIGDYFPTKFVLTVQNGESKEACESKNFNYILQRKNEIKHQYRPDEVEFFIKQSEVRKCRKPVGREFTNLPDWEIKHWGVNPNGEYYCAGEGCTPVKKLKERIY